MTAVSTDTPTSPRAMTIAGWTLSGLFIAFMIFDVTLKLIGHPEVRRPRTSCACRPAAGSASA